MKNNKVENLTKELLYSVCPTLPWNHNTIIKVMIKSHEREILRLKKSLKKLKELEFKN